MLVHLPRGNKLAPKNNPTLYAINALIQGIGKNQTKRRIAEPIGKKTREKLFRLINKYMNETNKTIKSRKVKKPINKP
tara:strand:+ start:2067 stop:2300 length:234 start_codon:yes stop_codon:yes gene_type:complete